MKSKTFQWLLAVMAALSVARIWLGPGLLWWRVFVALCALGAVALMVIPKRHQTN